MVLYRILFGINALVALVFVWFFLEGLSDGTVSSFNGLLWFATLAVIAAILGGGVALHRTGHRGWACALLFAPAALAVGFVGFMLLVLASGMHH